MRVLYVEGAFGFGGSLTGVLEVIRHLPADVTAKLVTRYDIAEYVDVDGLDYEVLDIPAFPANPRNVMQGLYRIYRYDLKPWARELKRVVRQFKPDLIHANNGVGSNLGVGLAGRRLGVPTISHQKGFEHLGPLIRGVCKHGLFRHHIATSHATAEHLFAAGLPRSRCTMIYDALNPPTFEPVPADNSPPVVAMFSMLQPWKGQDVFLRAVAKAREECPHPFRAVVAGKAPGNDLEYPQQLARLANELGIGDIVQFVGHQKDVYGFLRGIDIAVHASVQPEPFGRVGAEAMVCGLPVIVTDGGGISEYVDEGRTGFVVPMGDVQSMAGRITKLVVDKTARHTMGKAAREHVLTAFAPRLIVEQTLQVYRAVLAH